MSKPLTSSALALLSVTIATAVSQSFGRFTYSLLFTDVRDDLEVSSTLAGGIGSANLIAYLVGSFLVSLVVGAWGLTRVAHIGLAGVTTGLALLTWGPNVAVVGAALVLTGFAAAGVWVTAPAIATGLVDQDRRGRAMGTVGTGIGFGIVAASLLEIVFDDRSFRAVYAVELVVGIIATAAVLATLPRRSADSSRKVRGMQELRRVPRWPLVLLEYALFALGMILVMTFTVGFLEEDAGASSGTANSAFMLIGVGTLIGGPVFGPLTDRLGRLPGQAAALTMMTASTLVITTGNTVAALVGAFLFGLSFTGGPVTIGARISDHLDGDAFGAAYGIVTIAFGAGLAVGPQIGGVLEDLTDSFRPALWLSATCAAVATLVTLYEIRGPRRAGATPGRPDDRAPERAP